MQGILHPIQVVGIAREMDRTNSASEKDRCQDSTNAEDWLEHKGADV